MANQKIRIKLKAYEHNLIDQSASKIVERPRGPAHAFPAPSPFQPRRR